MASSNSSDAGWLSFSAGTRQSSDISCSPSSSHTSRTNINSSSTTSKSSSSNASSSGGSRNSSSSGTTSRTGTRSSRSSSSSSSTQWPTTFGCSPQYRSRGSTSTSSCIGGHGNSSSRKTTGSKNSTRSDGGHVDSDVSCCSSSSSGSNARMSVAFCRWRCGTKRCSSSIRQGGGGGGISLSLSNSRRRKDMNVSSVTSLHLSFLKGAAVAGATYSHVPLLLLALLLLRQSEYMGGSALTPDDDKVHVSEHLLQVVPSAATESESNGVKKASSLGASPLLSSSSLPSWPTSATDSFPPTTASHPGLHFPDGRPQWQLREGAAQYIPPTPPFVPLQRMQADPTARAAVVAEGHQVAGEGQLTTVSAAGRIAAAAAEGGGQVPEWLPSPRLNGDLYQRARPHYQETTNTQGVAHSLQDVDVNTYAFSLPSVAPFLPPESFTAARRAAVAAKQSDVRGMAAAATARATTPRNGGTTVSERIFSDTVTGTVNGDDRTNESSSSNSLPYFQPLLSAIQSSHRCQHRFAGGGLAAAQATPPCQRHATSGEAAVRAAGGIMQIATGGSHSGERREGGGGAFRPGGPEPADNSVAGARGRKWVALLKWNKSRQRSHSWSASAEAKAAGREGKRGVVSIASSRRLPNASHTLNLSALGIPTDELALKKWQQRLQPSSAYHFALHAKEARRERTRGQPPQRVAVYSRQLLPGRPTRWAYPKRRHLAGAATPDLVALAAPHHSASVSPDTTAANSESSGKQQRAAQRRSRLQAVTAASSKLFVPIEAEAAAAAGGTKRQRTTEKSKPTAAVQYYWPHHDSVDSQSSVASSPRFPPYTAPRPHSSVVVSQANNPPADISPASAGAVAAIDSSTSPTLDNDSSSFPSTRRHPPLRASYNPLTSPAAAVAWSFSFPEGTAANGPRAAVIYPATFDRIVFAPHLSSADSADAGAAAQTETVGDAGSAEASKWKGPETAAAAQTHLFLQLAGKRPPADADISDSATADSSQSAGASSAATDIAASLSTVLPSNGPASAALDPNAASLPSVVVVNVSGAAGKGTTPEEQRLEPQRQVKVPENQYSQPQVLLATEGGFKLRSPLHEERGAEEDPQEELRESTTRRQTGEKEQLERQHWRSAEPLQLTWAAQQQRLQHMTQSQHQEEDPYDDLAANETFIVEQTRRDTPSEAAPETPLQQQKRRAKELQMRYMQRREKREKKQRRPFIPKSQVPLHHTDMGERSTQQQQRLAEEAIKELKLLQQGRRRAHQRKQLLWQQEEVETADGEDEEQTTGWKQQRRRRIGTTFWGDQNLASGAFAAGQATKGRTITREDNNWLEDEDTDNEEEAEDVQGDVAPREVTGNGHTGVAGRRAEEAAAQVDTAVPVKTATPQRLVDTMGLLAMISPTDKPSQPSRDEAVVPCHSSTANLPQSCPESASQHQPPRQRREAVTEQQTPAEEHTLASVTLLPAAQQPAAGATVGALLLQDPSQQLHQQQGIENEPPKKAVEVTDCLQQRKKRKRLAPPPPAPPETPLPQQQEEQPLLEQKDPSSQGQKQPAPSLLKAVWGVPQETALLLRNWQKQKAQLAKQQRENHPGARMSVNVRQKPPRRRHQPRQVRDEGAAAASGGSSSSGAEKFLKLPGRLEASPSGSPCYVATL